MVVALQALIYFGVGINSILAVAGLAASAYLFFIMRQRVVDIQKAGDELPKALDSLAYAELPMPVICVMTNHFRMKLDDVVNAYKKDAQKRKAIVLGSFKVDGITKRFIKNYPSKFINHGYVGEELLTGAK